MIKRIGFELGMALLCFLVAGGFLSIENPANPLMGYLLGGIFIAVGLIVIVMGIDYDRFSQRMGQ
jgi:hypothetical protein